MTILYFSNSFEQKEQFVEIVSQLDPNVKVDYVSKEWQVLFRLRKVFPLMLPHWIVIDKLSVMQNLGSLIDNIRKQISCSDIPVILFLPPHEISTVKSVNTDKKIFVYVQPNLPSEYKYVLRRILFPYPA